MAVVDQQAAAAKAAAEKVAAEKAAAAKAAAEKMAAEKAAAEKMAAEKAAAAKAAAEKVAAEKAAAAKAAAEKMAAEKAVAAKAAALGLLQPLEAMSLDADALRAATAAAVAYCDAQGAGSVADLVQRACKLIAHPQAVAPLVQGFCGLVPMAWRLLPSSNPFA
jgi:hypothetical protein